LQLFKAVFYRGQSQPLIRTELSRLVLGVVDRSVEYFVIYFLADLELVSLAYKTLCQIAWHILEKGFVSTGQSSALINFRIRQTTIPVEVVAPSPQVVIELLAVEPPPLLVGQGQAQPVALVGVEAQGEKVLSECGI
jgi:hypothetical protein